MKNITLHLMTMDKFLVPFIEFIDENFGRGEHKYIFITSERYEYGLSKKHDVEFLYTDEDIFHILQKYMNDAKKIILHGLKRDKVNKLFFKNQELLEKSYWIMWGGDFYFPDTQNELQKFVIQNIRYLVTGTKGEIEYVRTNYGAKGEHIEAFVYPSNLYKAMPFKKDKLSNTIKILVGNSSTQTNRHKQVFEQLKQYKDSDIEVYVPLSYGDFKYGMQVMKQGYELFGNKFKPIIDFMKEKEYNKFLGMMDIAIFNHNRQQGMGNIITLLGMGKKVYMNPEITTYKMFIKNNIYVFDFAKLNLKPILLSTQKDNMKNVSELFNIEIFIRQLDFLKIKE